MEGETIVNGSHQVEADPSEKILKPRKPKDVNVIEHNYVIKNGNGETCTDITENNDIENGHVDDISKQNGNEQEFKVGTPRKLRRESRMESTPKPEILLKRELRRRETTPRASSPKINVALPSSDLPEEKQSGELKTEIKDNQEINMEKHKIDEVEVESQESNLAHESVIILEETREEVISINESVDVKESEEAGKSTSVFSIFTKSYKSNLSSDLKDSIEASSSSPSVICLDSPRHNIPQPSSEIEATKPINSFSKFPGRTVSILSLDRSFKRKADDSFDHTEKKKFAGNIETGSEKSPGWHFYSSSSWSPVHESKQPKSSTPFRKRAEEPDSMAVNCDESINMSFSASDVKEQSAKTGKWCSIM